jgi:TolA-binding protein
VRTLVEQERWEEAAARLLALPGRYPQYHSFKENCLMAASIYENKLGDPERAAEILQSCAEKYPGTPLAAEARKQFERISGSR